MISLLHGTVTRHGDRSVVIDCGGVGYLVHVPGSVIRSLPPSGEPHTLFTLLTMTKTDVFLVGFGSEEERACFQMLTGVSGAGTKAGLAILSELDVQTVYQAIAAEDVEPFTGVKGVGKKLARRIVLECRDKVEKAFEAQISSEGQAPAGHPATLTAVDALVSLGYQRRQAAAVIRDLDPGLPAQALITQALQKISRKKEQV